jgi:hypothetical protein
MPSQPVSRPSTEAVSAGARALLHHIHDPGEAWGVDGLDPDAAALVVSRVVLEAGLAAMSPDHAAVERAGLAIGALLREKGAQATMEDLAMAALSAASERP